MSLLKTNTVYCRDCKDILSKFPEKSIDLIYIDPPFFSNKDYEVIWKDGYELRAFEDRWKGGIEHYIGWMSDRLRLCHRVLKDIGSMYLHCDWHANAHLRILMDEIFGENNFQNEIAWCYREAINSKKRWNRKHDTVFFYSKGSEWTFNYEDVLMPHSESNIRKYKYQDEKGCYRLMGRGIVGSPIQSRRDVPLEWEAKKPDLVYRHYLKEGTLPVDYWNIDIINQAAKERLGYPTQKPEALLERIIKASSNVTDIVLDPMCGCGTAIAVAHKLGRRWIGIDISPTACRLMTDRMRKIGYSIGESDIVGLPKSLDELRVMPPFEFQNWICTKLYSTIAEQKSRDMGVDGWTIEGIPLQIKRSEDIGRNIIDNFETAIRRVKKNKGIIVAFSFVRGAYEEVARAKIHDGIEIELKTVESILIETKA